MQPRYAPIRTGLAVAAVALLPSAGSAHAPAPTFAAFGTPSVDGAISPGEWDGAARHPFRANTPGGGTVAAELLVMNDEARMYFGIRLETAAPTAVAAAFDNDHDGITPEEGDDGFSLDELGRLFDTVRSRRGGCPAGAICGFRDAELGGTEDVGAARRVLAAQSHIELWHALDSADDANDVSARPGQTLGFGLQVGVCGVSPPCVLTQAVPFGPMGDLLVAEPVAPQTVIADGPAEGAFVPAGTASFSVAGTDNVDAPDQLTFACSLDEGPVAPCTSPVVYTGLADGEHRFAVLARDRSGNVDATAATRTWTVDTTAPETALGDGPARLTRSRAARFAFSGSDALTAGAALAFRCRLDRGAWTPCASPLELTALRDGRHALSVAAEDQAGNVDGSPAEHAWTVDGTAPAKPRVLGPRTTSARRPAFRFSSTDALTPTGKLAFLCAVDSHRLRACERVYRPRLRPGRHVLRVAAVDEAGNRSATARIAVSVTDR